MPDRIARPVVAVHQPALPAAPRPRPAAPQRRPHRRAQRVRQVGRRRRAGQRPVEACALVGQEGQRCGPEGRPVHGGERLGQRPGPGGHVARGQQGPAGQPGGDQRRAAEDGAGGVAPQGPGRRQAVALQQAQQAPLAPAGVGVPRQVLVAVAAQDDPPAPAVRGQELDGVRPGGDAAGEAPDAPHPPARGQRVAQRRQRVPRRGGPEIGRSHRVRVPASRRPRRHPRHTSRPDYRMARLAG